MTLRTQQQCLAVMAELSDKLNVGDNRARFSAAQDRLNDLRYKPRPIVPVPPDIQKKKERIARLKAANELNRVTHEH